MRLPRTNDQQCLCPEAQYWPTGEVVMIGKGSRASLFVVTGRVSETVAILRYKRDMAGTLQCGAACSIQGGM